MCVVPVIYSPMALEAYAAVLLLISLPFVCLCSGLRKSSKITAASEFRPELTELKCVERKYNCYRGGGNVGVQGYL